jgi:hypothetical protein
MATQKLTRASHFFLIPALTFILSVFFIEAEDIFSNIVTGQYLWQTKSLPHEDPFSFTGPYPWMINRALPSLLFYAVHSLGGLPAIQIFCAMILSLTYLIFYSVWSRRTQQPTLTFIIASLVVLASCYWFQTRIYVFAYLYFITSLILITSNNLKVVALIAPLQVAWINSHPSAILGMFIAGIWWVLSAFKERRFKGAHSLILLSVILANLISPMGWGAFTKFAEEIFTPHPSRSNIFEWFSPFSEMVSGQYLSWWFYGSCVLGLAWLLYSFSEVGSLFSNTVLTLTSLALLSISLGCARHIPLFYLAFGSMLTLSLSSWIKLGYMKLPLWLSWAAPLVVALLTIKVAIFGYGISWNNRAAYRTFNLGVHPYKFPEAPIQIIKKAKVEGNVFSNYDTGAYFLYRMYPNYKVYLDGARLDEVYGEAAYHHYMLLGNDINTIKNDIERYDIRAFIIPLPPRASEIVTIHRFLSSDKAWRLAYLDDVNMLFIKASEAQARSIPTYAFLTPFTSLAEIIKGNPDAQFGLDRDFKQGDVINPNSIAFLLLKHQFLSHLKLKSDADKTVLRIKELCKVEVPSPGCDMALMRF